MVNVGKYTIHGSCGIYYPSGIVTCVTCFFLHPWRSKMNTMRIIQAPWKMKKKHLPNTIIFQVPFVNLGWCTSQVLGRHLSRSMKIPCQGAWAPCPVSWLWCPDFPQINDMYARPGPVCNSWMVSFVDWFENAIYLSAIYRALFHPIYISSRIYIFSANSGLNFTPFIKKM